MRYVYGGLARAGKVKHKTPKVKKSKAKKKQLTGRAKRRRQYNIKNNFKPTKENWESEVKNSKSIRSILVGTVSIPMPKSFWRDKKIKDFSTHLTSRKLGPKYRERQRERRNFEEEKMSFCYSTQSIEDSISCFRNHGGDIFKTKRGNFEEKPRIFRRLPHLVEGLIIHSKNWKEGSSHQWAKRHLVRRYRYRTVVRGREIVVGANSTLFVRIIEQEEEK